MAVENVATKELLQALLGPGQEVTPAWYAKARCEPIYIYLYRYRYRYNVYNVLCIICIVVC